ncbi:MAG: DapH/DapD/GlmU-related protein [Ginsengibacter sp.]
MIEDNALIGSNATFTNDIAPQSKQYPKSFTRTKVEEGASIDANATILAGIKIGRYSMIGAGCILTKDTDPSTFWFRNPAKHKGFVTRNGKILNANLLDKYGKEYKLVNTEPILED